MTRTRALLIAALVAVVAVAGVVVWRAADEDDPFAAYCEEVAEHQQPLGEVLSEGSEGTGFLDALPAFRDLHAAAPRDIRDEWAIVVDRIEGLQQALAEAGVDPATYDRSDLPEGVTKQDRASIDAAANSLSAPESRNAFGAVAQHARDVCHTPLYL